MTEIRKQEHITKEMFDCWQQGTLESSQEALFLEHIEICTFCAEKFGTWMEKSLMEPPAYLKEEVLKRTRQLDIQTAVKVKQTSKRMRLMMYSLKVGFAVAASIFLLTVTTGVQKMNMEVPEQFPRTEHQEDGLIDKLNRGSSAVTDTLNQMANSLFQIEREGSEEQK